MEQFITHIGDFFLQLGYIGIFIMMFLEASFFPFPSEIAMIPAGFLVSQGKMSPLFALLAGTLGSLSGATFNYLLGKYAGRTFLEKFGKYIFLDSKKIDEMTELFKRKGALIVFFGRLIPVVRQYISFPPGVSNMNFFKFSLYTGLGSCLWVGFLEFLGYYYGHNQNAINGVILKFKFISLGILIVFGIFIIKKKLQKKSTT